MTGRQKQYVDTNLGKRISQLQLVWVTFTLHSSKWTKQLGQKQLAQNKHVGSSSGCHVVSGFDSMMISGRPRDLHTC